MPTHHRDVEVNAKSSSPEEKADERDIRVERSESLVSLPDPDAGKSDAERAAIVCLMSFSKSPRTKIIQDRALMWKVDRWLIPWLCLLYLLSFLDRTNIGNARLAGMEPDLNMNIKGHDYNNSLTIFFVR